MLPFISVVYISSFYFCCLHLSCFPTAPTFFLFLLSLLLSLSSCYLPSIFVVSISLAFPQLLLSLLLSLSSCYLPSIFVVSISLAFPQLLLSSFYFSCFHLSSFPSAPVIFLLFLLSPSLLLSLSSCYLPSIFVVSISLAFPQLLLSSFYFSCFHLSSFPSAPVIFLLFLLSPSLLFSLSSCYFRPFHITWLFLVLFYHNKIRNVLEQKLNIKDY